MRGAFCLLLHLERLFGQRLLPAYLPGAPPHYQAPNPNPLPHTLTNYPAGRGSEIGDYLTTHPLVNAISFTGGDTGIDICRKAAMVPIQVRAVRAVRCVGCAVRCVACVRCCYGACPSAGRAVRCVVCAAAAGAHPGVPARLPSPAGRNKNKKTPLCPLGVGWGQQCIKLILLA